MSLISFFYNGTSLHYYYWYITHTHTSSSGGNVYLIVYNLRINYTTSVMTNWFNFILLPTDTSLDLTQRIEGANNPNHNRNRNERTPRSFTQWWKHLTTMWDKKPKRKHGEGRNRNTSYSAWGGTAGLCTCTRVTPNVTGTGKRFTQTEKQALKLLITSASDFIFFFFGGGA